MEGVKRGNVFGSLAMVVLVLMCAKMVMAPRFFSLFFFFFFENIYILKITNLIKWPHVNF
jgi:hypothetical protein